MAITAAEVRRTDFTVTSRFKRGYTAGEVDRFVERIALRLETGTGISSNDVYHVSFTKAPLADRSYAEDDVDGFLDRIHAELLRLEDAWGQHRTARPGAHADPADLDDPVAPGDESGEGGESVGDTH